MNVIQIKELIKQDNAYDLVEDFAKEYGLNSKATYGAYLADAKQFIRYLFGDKTYVSNTELAENFTRPNLIRYRNYLVKDLGLKANSINRKFSSIKELSKFMYGLEYPADFNVFESLQYMKSDSHSYEALTVEEADMIIEWIKANERKDRLKKYYYCQIALDTGLRAEAINNLTKASFIVKDNRVLVRGFDKGTKEFVKVISPQFYNELYYELEFDLKEIDEPLFSFTSQQRSEMMKRAKKGLGWEHRRIAFHSFKKAAVTNVYTETKDIRLAQQVGGHSSVVTTERYLKDFEVEFQGAVSSRATISSKEINFSDFTKEQLIEALGNVSEGNQLNVKKALINLTK